MTRYLLTPSLQDAWRFYNLIDSKTKENFLDVLNKKEIEKTEAMQKGLNFEADILAATNGEYIPAVPEMLEPYDDCVFEIASVVDGGHWQERVMKDITLCGMDFLLYGKMDVVKRNWIYDIKRTDKYDTGKYTASIQHPIYMFCSGIHNFAYLVSDAKTVWIEEYFYSQEEEARMRGELADMVNGIMADHDFKDAFLAHWQTKEAA